MQLIRPQGKDWQEKTGYSKKILLNFEDSHQGIVIQQIKIKPGEIAKAHFHKKQTEIFYFNEINGEFMVNGKNVALQPTCVLVVEPNDIHEVKNTSEKDFEYYLLC